MLKNGTAIAPAQTVVERVKFDKYGNAKGSIKTTATHPVSLKGYVITSHGRVTTDVTQNISFSNVQKFSVTSSQYAQNIVQSTTIASTSRTTSIKSRNYVVTGSTTGC